MAKKTEPTDTKKRLRIRDNGDQKFTRAKESVKESLEKHKGKLHFKSEPEMAIEILDEKIQKSKPIEQALAAEHLFRKTIEESIPVGIAGFDTKWKQIYVNRVFCEMVGWSETELINMPFPQPYWPFETIHIPPGDQQHIFHKILTFETIEIQFQRRDGDRFWGLVFSNVLADSTAASIGRLISVTDITAQKHAENALRLLSTKLIGAQETERKHIAQDLHDRIGGKLTGIKYGLENLISGLDPKQANLSMTLQDMVTAVRSTLEEAQRITKNLHPSILDDLGLISAVRGYCREFQQFYPSIQVQMTFNLEEQNVPESLKILIYRVLQEAMNNAGKHSDAQNVRVLLNNPSGKIELIIEDDGKGFIPENISEFSQPDGGLGIESMKERTELFDGKFVLQSQPGHGTKIRALWPCSA